MNGFVEFPKVETHRQGQVPVNDVIGKQGATHLSEPIGLWTRDSKAQRCSRPSPDIIFFPLPLFPH